MIEYALQRAALTDMGIRQEITLVFRRVIAYELQTGDEQLACRNCNEQRAEKGRERKDGVESEDAVNCQ